jgi:hypothetical protein
MTYDTWGMTFSLVLPTFVLMSLKATVWFVGPSRAGVLVSVPLGKILISLRSRRMNEWARALMALKVAVEAPNQARVIRNAG